MILVISGFLCHLNYSWRPRRGWGGCRSKFGGTGLPWNLVVKERNFRGYFTSREVIKQAWNLLYSQLLSLIQFMRWQQYALLAAWVWNVPDQNSSASSSRIQGWYRRLRKTARQIPAWFHVCHALFHWRAEQAHQCADLLSKSQRLPAKARVCSEILPARFRRGG